MGRKTICYRGSLKSCNYRCSYCPFSKHRASVQELEKDRQNFGRFCESIADRAAEFDIGAVFVVPYGEASIHRWYWEGLGRLAGLDSLERVGLQTNLSFSVEECLAVFDLYSEDANRESSRENDEEIGRESSKGNDEEIDRESNKEIGRESDKEAGRKNGEETVRGISGAARRKLCIWATFHPEMTDMETFVDKCHRLAGNGVNLCVGAVGAPQNISLLGRLRERLSPDLYLWINKMDGLGRAYTEEENRPFWSWILFSDWNAVVRLRMLPCAATDASWRPTAGIRACNIGPDQRGKTGIRVNRRKFSGPVRQKKVLLLSGLWREGDFEERQFSGLIRSFGFRKPYQAVFLDLDGTLVPEKHRGRLRTACAGSACLREKCSVFLATSMPARKSGGGWRNLELFSGGCSLRPGLCVDEDKGGRRKGGRQRGEA